MLYKYCFPYSHTNVYFHAFSLKHLPHFSYVQLIQTSFSYHVTNIRINNEIGLEFKFLIFFVFCFVGFTWYCGPLTQSSAFQDSRINQLHG